MTDYRQVGEQLGAYIHANNPSISQIKALLADLLATDELLGPMLDAARLPGFLIIQDHASSGNGEIHKIAVLQSLSRKYLPSIVSSVEELLDGVLLLPKSHKRRPKTLSENRVLIAARALVKLPRLGKVQRLGSKVQADANTGRNLFSLNRSAWPFLLLAGVAASAWLLNEIGPIQIITGNLSPDKAKYSDFHYGAEWLAGKIIKKKPWVQDSMDRGYIDGLGEPGIWEGLPDNAVYVSGTLFGEPNPDKLGIDTYKMRDSYYFTFASQDLVLDAIKSPWGYWMRPGLYDEVTCTIRGKRDRELYAFPDEVEANRTMAEARQKSLDGEMLPTVTIDKPRHLYRFDTSKKKIVRIDGSRARCTGVVEDIANDY